MVLFMSSSQILTEQEDPLSQYLWPYILFFCSFCTSYVCCPAAGCRHLLMKIRFLTSSACSRSVFMFFNKHCESNMPSTSCTWLSAFFLQSTAVHLVSLGLQRRDIRTNPDTLQGAGLNIVEVQFSYFSNRWYSAFHWHKRGINNNINNISRYQYQLLTNWFFLTWIWAQNFPSVHPPLLSIRLQ